MFPHLPRHDLLLEHPPREVGRLQPHEAHDQLLGLVAVVLWLHFLTLLGRRVGGLDGVLELGSGPEDDELDDGVEERLARRLHVVLLSDIPGKVFQLIKLVTLL